MTLVNVNPTILEECQLCMHVDHEEKILCDSYIVEFAYDPTCNYYDIGKYCGRNFHVTKLPLFMLRLSMFYSSSLHMLVFVCFDNFLLIKCLSIGSMLALNLFFTCYLILSLCFDSCLSCEHH